MSPAQLHVNLMQACKNGDIEGVKHWLELGAEPNYNLNTAINALDIAIQIDNHPIITLLLEHGAIVKAFMIQKAIEKDKNYLALLIPDFTTCKDEKLLLGVLQAALNSDNFELAKQAVEQGAKPESLFLFAIQDFGSTKILQLLIENGFDIHADENALLTEWIGSCLPYEWGRKRSKREDFLAFIADYYIEKQESIEKFTFWRETNKSRLFRIGLDSNNVNMMKFSILIGADKSEAINVTLYRYYEKKSEDFAYEIVEYLLNFDIEFDKVTISNAVSFNYAELLNALNRKDDLEYGYEMAYKYENDVLCKYFMDRGISKESQYATQMKISAIKGNLKALQEAIHYGADLKKIDTTVIVEIINENQIESLKCLYDAGLELTSKLNIYLDEAMRQHKAYETVAYLTEQGLDISSVKNLPREFKIKYPAIADMRENRFRDIFDYTMYLAKEIYPKIEGKEKEEILARIAALSSLPYVVKRSEGAST